MCSTILHVPGQANLEQRNEVKKASTCRLPHVPASPREMQSSIQDDGRVTTSRLASISNVSALGQPVGIQYSKHLETSCIETETIHHIYHIHHHHPPPAACSHRRPPPPPRHGRCRPPRQRRRPCSCNRRGRSCQRYRRLPLRLRRRHSRQFSMFVVIASNSEVVIVIIIIIFTPLS